MKLEFETVFLQSSHASLDGLLFKVIIVITIDTGEACIASFVITIGLIRNLEDCGTCFAVDWLVL